MRSCFLRGVLMMSITLEEAYSITMNLGWAETSEELIEALKRCVSEEQHDRLYMLTHEELVIAANTVIKRYNYVLFPLQARKIYGDE